MEYKLTVFLLAVTILECNGHLNILGDILTNARERVQSGAEGIAGAVLGGLNLNFAGHLGINTNNRQPNVPQKGPEETIIVVVEEPNERDYRPHPPHHNHGRPPPPHHNHGPPPPPYQNHGPHMHERPHMHEGSHMHEGPHMHYGPHMNHGPHMHDGPHMHEGPHMHHGPPMHQGPPMHHGPPPPPHHQRPLVDPTPPGPGHNDENQGSYEQNGNQNHQGNDNSFGNNQNMNPYDKNEKNHNNNGMQPNPEYNQDNHENNNQQTTKPIYDSATMANIPTTESPKTSPPSKDEDSNKITGTTSNDLPLFVPLNPNEYVYGGDKINITAPKRDTENNKPVESDDDDFAIDIRLKN